MADFGQGFFYTPQDQTQLDALTRQRKLALALQQQGAQDPGDTPYAGLASAGKSLAGALLGTGLDDKERGIAQSAEQRRAQMIANIINGNTGGSITNSAGSPMPGPSQLDPEGNPMPSAPPATPGPNQTDPEGNPFNSMRPAQPPQAPSRPGDYNPDLIRGLAMGDPFALQAFQHRQALAEKMATPLKVGKDDRLYTPGQYDKPLVDVAPDKIDYNKAFLPDGTPNKAFQDYSMRERAAGRPQMSVSVNADRSFGTQLGENAGKILDASHSAAIGGVQTLQTVSQIKSALDSGKVSAGPGSTAVQFFNQVAGGNPDKVVATRETIQGLAKLTLAARGQMKGQGQISDYEGRLLQKATSGEIDSMTVPEIRAVTNVADRAARFSIQQNKQNVDKARKAAPGNQDLVDFYTVEEPPAVGAAPANTGGNSDIDALVNQYKTKPKPGR
jgi:hypothetical protein